MAVFSRIVVWTALAASTLFVSPVAADVDNGRAVARHLKHPQARAHHHVAQSETLPKRSRKRAADKKGRCAAKSSSSASASSTLSTTTPTATTPSTHHTTSHKHTTTATTSAAPETITKASSGGDDDGDSGSSGGGDGKAGLCWNDGNDFNLKMFGTGMSWYYTWSPWSACTGSNCPDFCPMFWSTKQLGDWNSQVKGQHQKCILGQNEPNQKGQSNMSPAAAAAQWKQYIQIESADIKVSPAITSDGQDWLAEFLQECSDCDIDACAVHDYGTDADAFKDRITQTYKTCGYRPIWVTEWAAQDYGSNPSQLDQAGVNKYMAETQAWLNEQSWVHRYAYFAPNSKLPSGFNTANRLMSSGGSVTALGFQYISAA